eukprot:PhM_4_TR1974/c0_g1_i2/m.43803
MSRTSHATAYVEVEPSMLWSHVIKREKQLHKDWKTHVPATTDLYFTGCQFVRQTHQSERPDRRAPAIDPSFAAKKRELFGIITDDDNTSGMPPRDAGVQRLERLKKLRARMEYRKAHVKALDERIEAHERENMRMKQLRLRGRSFFDLKTDNDDNGGDDGTLKTRPKSAMVSTAAALSGTNSACSSTCTDEAVAALAPAALVNSRFRREVGTLLPHQTRAMTRAQSASAASSRCVAPKDVYHHPATTSQSLGWRWDQHVDDDTLRKQNEHNSTSLTNFSYARGRPLRGPGISYPHTLRLSKGMMMGGI